MQKNNNFKNLNNFKFILINTIFLALFIIAIGFTTVFAVYDDNYAIVNSARSMQEQFILVKQTNSSGQEIDKFFSTQTLKDFGKATATVPQKLYQTNIKVSMLGGETFTLSNFVETKSFSKFNLNLYKGGKYPKPKDQSQQYEQIVISDYYADQLLKNGYKTFGNDNFKPKSYKQILKNPINCYNTDGQTFWLQITGVYKTNYKQYSKTLDPYKTSKMDLAIDEYMNKYAFNTTYTTVGFSERQASTIKKLSTQVYTKQNTGFINGEPTSMVLTNKYIANENDEYKDILKIFAFSGLEFNEVGQGEIILPVSLFNTYFAPTTPSKHIDSKTLFDCTTTTQAQEYMQTAYGANLNNLYFTMRVSNQYETTFYRFKVVGLSTAFMQDGTELSEKITRLHTQDMTMFVKDCLYSANAAVLAIDKDASILSDAIKYIKKSDLTFQTAGSDYVLEYSRTLRIYGLVISILAMIGFGVLFGYRYYRQNIYLSKQLAQNSTKQAFKSNIWPSLTIFATAFVASLLVSMLINFIINISINAIIGHLLIDVFISLLSFYVMFNAGLILILPLYLISTLLSQKPSTVVQLQNPEVEQESQQE